MSLFNPDPGALPNDSSVAYLVREELIASAQRDVSFDVPINHNPSPGIALTAACFANHVYEEAAASKCISNLLAIGFQRVDVDLYWDASGQKWSLCPVELGVSLTSSVSLAAPSRKTATLAQTSLNIRDHYATSSLDISTSGHLFARATGSTTSGESGSATGLATSSPTASGTSINNVTYIPPANGSTVTVGPYTCSVSLDLYAFMGIIAAYLDNTQTDINATTLVLTTHLHAASSSTNPAGSAQKPATNRLPHGGALLSSVINTNASSYIYSPTDLAGQRSNLNGTDGWYSVIQQNQPAPGFFTIVNNDRHYSTPDGWPNENYMILESYKRMLIQYGNVDPQMSEYDFSQDADTIFPAGFLSSFSNVTISATGEITQGCLYKPGVTDIQSVNGSWATYIIGTGTNTSTAQQQSLLAEAANMTACGISPILNSTLNSTSADRDFLPYQDFVRQTIWSWAPGQPLNSSSNISTILYRCASLNATSGSWQASDCTVSHYGACHNHSQPYVWSISSAQGSYGSVSKHCGSNATFDVPRTALENAYLVAAWREYLARFPPSSNNDGNPASEQSDRLLWLDLNDMDVNACWVVGQNSTCPYRGPDGDSLTHRVVVSTVSSIIVFAIAGLLLLTKCAGNHQSSKRRRKRGDDGWDYEGVPS